jgi:hypothetical protein
LTDTKGQKAKRRRHSERKNAGLGYGTLADLVTF